MKLSQVKTILNSLKTVNFTLEDGTAVPEHFHVTEVGLITKNFIDCGGTVRKETVVNFQLWDANDYDHRLKPQKLVNIIELSEKVLGIQDFEIEVEFQTQTIGLQHSSRQVSIRIGGEHRTALLNIAGVISELAKAQQKSKKFTQGDSTWCT